MTGEEPLERETISGICYMTIPRLCEVIPFWDHWLLNSWYERCNWAQLCRYDVPAAWLHRVRSLALFRDTESSRRMPVSQCWMRSRLTLSNPDMHRCYCKNQLLNQHRIKPDDELIWDRKTPYVISWRRSNDFQKRGEWPYRNYKQLYRKQSTYLTARTAISALRQVTSTGRRSGKHTRVNSASTPSDW